MNLVEAHSVAFSLKNIHHLDPRIFINNNCVVNVSCESTSSNLNFGADTKISLNYFYIELKFIFLIVSYKLMHFEYQLINRI
ncbi:hypothetical protein BpHYR1_012262 [Brachionus plicatilis]|uniref:Uncharacterized protein n=1 Tax=Brachionus plicatilis TaxID=10195 RepID=A0A3M7S9V4_BRAPC|nr:hypothetical protein BpHYR1_012262 [Brachionus plicatilis]